MVLIEAILVRLPERKARDAVNGGTQALKGHASPGTTLKIGESTLLAGTN
jgi:hypothetical protein